MTSRAIAIKATLATLLSLMERLAHGVFVAEQRALLPGSRHSKRLYRKPTGPHPFSCLSRPIQHGAPGGSQIQIRPIIWRDKQVPLYSPSMTADSLVPLVFLDSQSQNYGVDLSDNKPGFPRIQFPKHAGGKKEKIPSSQNSIISHNSNIFHP